MFAYTIAKHYNISLTEVYNMSEEIFKQSLVWALVSQDQEEKAERKSRMAESGSDEVVDFDYSFLEMEDF
mgnify:CR=1 FL=1